MVCILYVSRETLAEICVKVLTKDQNAAIILNVIIRAEARKEMGDGILSKIIVFSNQKGGVGKTTSAVNIAAALSKKKYKVLLIDMDSQGNATSGVGISKKAVEATSYDVLTGEITAKEAIIATSFPNLSIIPSSIDLAGAEIDLADESDRNLMLKNALSDIKSEFDYILIDCPPSLGTVSINALCAADGVIIPMTCEYYALEGLSQLVVTIREVKRLFNPSLDITGILITMYDKRLNLAKQVLAEIDRYYADKLFKTMIVRNIRITEAPSFGKPVIYFDKYSKGSMAYEKVAAELVKRI